MSDATASTPPTPRLSATVLLVQDAPTLKVLMVERHYQIDFASGALVFPGGKADDDDRKVDWEARLDGAGAADEQRVAKIAAAREAFEEAGILLARPETARGDGKPLVSPEAALALDSYRRAVDTGEKSFLELMAENGMVLALDQLIHFAHWITPLHLPKRFDTHFYLSPTPPGQAARQDGIETTEAIWIEPKEALARAEAGKATMMFPTRLNLAKLDRCANVPEALETFAGAPVMTVLPQLSTDEDGERWLEIPVEAGYEVSRTLASRG